MIIYIAAPWADREKMPEISKRFEDEGHGITWKWWLTEDIKESARTFEALQEQAFNDVKGVVDAQLVVLLNNAKSEGKAFETGLAVAQRKPIIAVGKLGAFSLNVFHYLPSFKWVDSVDEALDVLRTIDWLVKNGE